MTSSLLTALLPSMPYILAYCLPLLLVSILLTFAGAFLTLDRTNTFPPSYDVIPDTSEATRKVLPLEGGIGGLALGFAFGHHLSTFLSLLIPAVSTLAPLSPKSYLAVWILSATPSALLGGRWKYCALLFAGIASGALVTLTVSVILHPALLTRVILVAINIPLFTLMTLLPIDRFQHASFRFAASATGSFGIILSIALLVNIPAWANVWERLWLSDKLEWGSEKEKGLSAAFCLIFVAGSTCDWVLRWKFGVCPDQKWDRYLAQYTGSLPHRAGTFQPLHSMWDRVFGQRRSNVSNVVLRAEKDLKVNPQQSFLLQGDLTLRKQYSRQSVSTTKSAAFAFQRSFRPLKKGRSQWRASSQVNVDRREAVKFRTLGDAYGSDSDEVRDEESCTPTSIEGHIKPWRIQQPLVSSSGSKGTLEHGSNGGNDPSERARANLVNVEVGLEKRQIPEYSDHEEDVTKKPGHSEDVLGWTPEFLRRHGRSLCKSDIEASSTSNLSRQTLIASPPLAPHSPPHGAVLATPSLIQALDRIAIAQRTAFGPLDMTTESGSCSSASPGLPPHKSYRDGNLPITKNRYKGPQWDEFWKDIREKARA